MGYKALEKYDGVYGAVARIGHEYVGEAGKSGDRRPALQQIESALMAAFAKARQNQAANLGPQTAGVGGVKALAAWHTGQMTGAKDAAQKKLNDAVIFLRKWLSRQKAWFSGDGRLNWPMTMRFRVVYDAEIRNQIESLVTISGGLLYTSKNDYFDTAGFVTHFSGPGKAIYVMSPAGNLHVSSHSVGHRHHSSLLAGNPVACAGEIEVKRGRIVWLSNKSGHYLPGREHLLQVLAMLQKKGVPLDFRLTVLGAGAGNYPTVDEYMKAQMLDDANYDKLVENVQVVYARYVTSVDGYKRPVYDGQYR